MGPFDGLFSVAVGDFNNDDRLDIAATNANNIYVGVILGYSMPFAMTVMYATGNGSAPYSVNVGDFNNDNRLDVIVANSGTNEVGVLLGFGDGTFAGITTYSAGDGSNPHCVTSADLNNDDRLDIIVANYGTNNIGVLLGYGNGFFANITIFLIDDSSHPFWVTFADFNNDNQLDIAVANSDSNNIVILLGYGNGSFGKQTSYLIGYGSHPYAIAIGDFNNDSWMDMAVANYDKQGIDILLQMC
jgi:streptogramin lyase